MAIPTFFNTGTNVTNLGSSAISYPASMAIDDFILLVIEHADEAVAHPFPPTGGSGTTAWTEIGTTVTQGGVKLTVGWAIATSATPVGATVPDSGDHTQHRVAIFRGTDLTNPVHLTGTNTQTPATTSGSITGITTTVDECMIVLCSAADLPDSSTTTEFGAPSNANLGSLTERADNSVATGNGGAKMISTGTLAVAGATGTTTFTSVTSSVKAHRIIALQPPQVVAGIPDVVHSRR